MECWCEPHTAWLALSDWHAFHSHWETKPEARTRKWRDQKVPWRTFCFTTSSGSVMTFISKQMFSFLISFEHDWIFKENTAGLNWLSEMTIHFEKWSASPFLVNQRQCITKTIHIYDMLFNRFYAPIVAYVKKIKISPPDRKKKKIGNVLNSPTGREAKGGNPLT